MSHPNQDLINRFFEAYGQRDLEALRQVVAEDVRWVFPGRNSLSGIKQGPKSVGAFFKAMGGVYGWFEYQSGSAGDWPGEDYVSECQHIQTNRDDGVNLEQVWCVLWKFANGKIVEGRHLASDQQAADAFFTKVTQ